MFEVRLRFETNDLMPYQSVDLFAKVTGFVESISVDRGSRVRRGEELVTLTAPELTAQAAEAQAKPKILNSQWSV